MQSVRGEERRSGGRRRQFRSAEQKRQMVQETLAPGASVAVIARRHVVNASQLFSWRRQYRRGVLELVNAPVSAESALVPITVAPIETPHEEGWNAVSESRNGGRIDIKFGGAGAFACGVGQISRHCVRSYESSRAHDGLPPGIRIWLVAGITDMRKGINSLSALVQTAPKRGHLWSYVRHDRGSGGHDPPAVCLPTRRIANGCIRSITCGVLQVCCKPMRMQGSTPSRSAAHTSRVGSKVAPQKSVIEYDRPRRCRTCGHCTLG